MHKVIHSDAVKAALQQRGWTQKELAARLGVTAQAVTNWFSGKDFPRPDKLLKLAAALRLPFEQLVKQEPSGFEPIIAFRTKANVKTTDAHVLKARAMGTMLGPLLEFLEPMSGLPRTMADTSTGYANLQANASEVRKTLGVGEAAVLQYEDLIGEFAANRAVLVPVMWGHLQSHRNALHILLPQTRTTFIFLNLDTHLEDFKFWMAHELAHVFTPQLAGRNEGEDFADSFAAALLFPRELARTVYTQVAGQPKAHEAAVLQAFAREHGISLNTVFQQVNDFAQSHGLPALKHTAVDIHRMRTAQRGKLVSETLFAPLPPAPSAYVSAAERQFHSDFFQALRRMVKDKQTGAGYIQQVMDIPMQDALALHAELTR